MISNTLSLVSWKLQMLFQFIKLLVIWDSPIIGMRMYYLFSKLLERLVYNQRVVFINNNRVLYEYKFRFQKHESTHHAIVLLTDKIITEALHRGECLICVFF